MWLLAFAFYIAAAAYIVFHLHYMINDALTRVDNAFDVLYSRDPHLAAIGFFWPPLPSFLDLPILAFNHFWPVLAAQGFAGSIEAAAFSAGSVVLVNAGLRWAGVVRGLRWVLCLIWLINPMVIIFASQGMAEAPFVFFALGSLVVFLRWSESQRTALLPLMGVLAGCAALCRSEAVLFAVVLGVGVALQSLRNERNWRRVETEALLYGLPALLFIGLWVVTAAIIFHDPLYVLHANNVAAAGSAASPAPPPPSTPSTPNQVVGFSQWGQSIAYVLEHSVLLYPAAAALLGFLAVRVLTKQGRVAGFVLVACGASILAADVYLVHGRGLGNYLRYQIIVIPLAYVAGMYVLRSLRSRRALLSSLVALALGGVFGLSNIFTAQTLSDPNVAVEEAPVMAALSSGGTVGVGGDFGAINYGPTDVQQIVKMDRDHGLILCDSSDCFPFNVNAPDPKLFVVTSDRDWEAALNQPQVYGVEYFLVPDPVGAQAVDRLNTQYPTLFADGGGFSVLVGTTADGGWRLYRVILPTGRG